MIGESHLTSMNDDRNLEIDGYMLKRCDHPNDESRGGVAIYYKSSLPTLFKPELTELSETLVFQAKIKNKKCFFTCIYRRPSNENNLTEKVKEFFSKLDRTLHNIRGKIPTLTLLLVILMQKILPGLEK